ncbi:MAG TPA: helix-turn-helix transcriptional regulator [Jiangellaceae bacterium]|nr:helix-turn-helix transcriptional regulator [Jiangellaceae bacterium]
MPIRQARTAADPDTRTAVGTRIRSLRLERGLSQADVAGGTLSASYVSLVESGRRQPASAALQHIADRLGVDAGFLRDGVDAEVRRRARLALGYAELALERGDVDEAHRRFGELIGEPGLGEDHQRQVHMGLALAAERRGDLEEALRVLGELADQARRSPAVHPWMDVAESLCRCYREAGDLDLAISTGEEAMRHAADLGLDASDEYVRLGCTVQAAYQERGDITKAYLMAGDLVRTADTMGAPHTRGAAYWNAALIAESRGEVAQALVLVERAVAMFGESDDRRNLGRIRVAHALLLLQQSPPEAERALELLDSVRPDLVDHGGAVDVGYCDTERARALLILGRLEEARLAAERSLAGLGEMPRLEAAQTRLLLGRVFREQGDIDACVEQTTLAAAMLEAMGASRRAAAAWRELGDLYRDLSHMDATLDAYDRALRAVRVPPAAAGRQSMDSPGRHEAVVKSL